MRIQHNIPAMSAYRNYTANTSAVAKSLEKLSSGYKINRAGDDAAGLAISEKMRAQITGLETAQKNAKDGISLVQTAEGALTEVHDMLNRMYELAEQSANGTYSDDVDREQLQKEVDSLRSEINRIADSSNFNGIKLLDGSLDGDDRTTVNATSFGGKMNLLGVGSPFGGSYWQDTGSGTKDASVKVNFDNDGDGTEDSLEVNGTQGGSMILHQEATGAAKTSFEIDLSNASVSALNSGEASTVELKLNDMVKTFGGSDTVKLTANLTADGDGNISNDRIAQGLYDSLSTADYKVTINDVEYGVSLNGNTLRFEMTDKGFATAAAYASANDGNSLKFEYATDGNSSSNVTLSAKNSAGTTAYVQGDTDLAVSNATVGNMAKETQLADFYTESWGAGHIVDGAGITIGDTNYVFAGTDKTLNAQYDSTVKVIDIRDIYDKSAGQVKALIGDAASGQSGTTEALRRVTVAAADNDMYSVQLVGNGATLSFREKTTYSGDADLSTVQGVLKSVQYFKQATANVDTRTATGKALSLQIGDTAESFNKMSVNVADCHAAAMGIGDIDISTQDGASTAMDAIKNAINYVSDVRGGLGALQNRLDHTINNLGVQQQNIQDAESTIRDVDVAAEMMTYTKNNILVQSAQAMLAQANQLPQGVLQLLG